MTQQDFIPNNYLQEIQSGEITSQAPSNIALIKYWGKRENQIPANPSLSFTLKNCLTRTSIRYKRREDQEKTSFEVYLDNSRNDDFRPKIEKFLEMTAPYLPFLKDYFLEIRTS
ncbi:MAG TPA: diphosphomevalonate decarboxylase, partial [Salinimicrobium sp.]|nr:diphosphomevalonate decarboxylase [Salinimicrobium sp.]